MGSGVQRDQDSCSRERVTLAVMSRFDRSRRLRVIGDGVSECHCCALGDRLDHGKRFPLDHNQMGHPSAQISSLQQDFVPNGMGWVLRRRLQESHEIDSLPDLPSIQVVQMSRVEIKLASSQRFASSIAILSRMGCTLVRVAGSRSEAFLCLQEHSLQIQL